MQLPARRRQRRGRPGDRATPVSLAYRIEGDDAGLPVVLVHPLGADQSFWDECRGRFGPGIRTVSFDSRGSGRSPDLSEPLTLDRIAADIEELRIRLDLGRIALVGCAVGAMAAARYAAGQPAHTVALVMSNPGIRIAGDAAQGLRTRARAVRDDGMQALMPQAIENAFAGCGDTERRRLYEAAFLAQSPQNYAFAALGVAGSDIGEDAARIECPVLLTPGGNDRLFGASHSGELAGVLGDAETVAFPDGAHFIPYQLPAEFGDAVSSFLDRRGLRP